MKTAALPAIGTLNTTLPDPGDATYQTESLALSLHQTLKNLSDSGFEFQSPESSDFTTFGNDTQGALDNYIDRYEDILQTGFSAVVANLPDVLPIIGTIIGGGGEGILSILLQGVLDTLLRHRDIRSDVADGDPLNLANSDMSGVVTELQDIEAKLEEVREEIMATLNEFNINVYEDEEGASWSVGPLVP